MTRPPRHERDTSPSGHQADGSSEPRQDASSGSRDDAATPAGRVDIPPPPPPWDRGRKRPAPARVPLTQERIVEAAYVVLDREGYDGLSMRQVAAELGVAVSALYAHVSGKDDLLQLMYERLFEGYELPAPDPERWTQQVTDFAHDWRALLLRHRDMARISMAQVPFTPAMLPTVEKLFAIFRAAGLPDEIAGTAGDILATYIDGFSYEESMWEERQRDSAAANWDEMRTTLMTYFASLPPDHFPSLVALSDHLFHTDNDARFSLGLDILLRGLSTFIPKPP
ncbi:TetR/AcrR family transcriptional regulator [Sphaerisporangium aureirubrum]|uniref:TetR/AcrR family transcriptional regulator n=1 Tax=Sphaerisporangium aureirubrum TaxID=1544736 RepID=A0ABW1NIZ1_9ACTN